MKNAIPLKIRQELRDTGGGTFRYDFSVSPLVQNSGIYRFMRYCLQCDIDKSNKENTRAVIARDLRKKHSQTWERYRTWLEDR